MGVNVLHEIIGSSTTKTRWRATGQVRSWLGIAVSWYGRWVLRTQGGATEVLVMCCSGLYVHVLRMRLEPGARGGRLSLSDEKYDTSNFETSFRAWGPKFGSESTAGALAFLGPASGAQAVDLDDATL